MLWKQCWKMTFAHYFHYDFWSTKDFLAWFISLESGHLGLQFKHIFCLFGLILSDLLLGLVSLNPIVSCYVWHYVWHYVWLNVVSNKVVLLLSKIMVIWIFGHYHIVHEMHSMWFLWFSHRRYKPQVLCKLRILVRSWWWNWAFHLQRL